MKIWMPGKKIWLIFFLPTRQGQANKDRHPSRIAGLIFDQPRPQCFPVRLLAPAISNNLWQNQPCRQYELLLPSARLPPAKELVLKLFLILFPPTQISLQDA